jgi:hypothetical protein
LAGAMPLPAHHLSLASGSPIPVRIPVPMPRLMKIWP